MIEALPNPGILTLLIGGQSIGTVAVARRHPRKVFGTFTPGPGFEPHRPVFEAAVELAQQFDEAAGDGSRPCDDVLWDRLMTAYAAINHLGPIFAELPALIEELAVNADWSVEVTFVEVSPA
jgi:hypothetical protein